jgi:hypothetical protein
MEAYVRKDLFIRSQLVLCLFLFCGAVQGQSADDISWRSMKTKYTVIHYQSIKDLKQFNDKVKYGQRGRDLGRPFSSPTSHDVEETIGAKVDLLFERIQEILDMRKTMKKVNINIYQDKRQLHDAYFEIYKKPSHIRACYRYTDNTVYINVKDLHEGLLAHELAHAVMDNYLLVRPPHATAEILARYVDKYFSE